MQLLAIKGALRAPLGGALRAPGGAVTIRALRALVVRASFAVIASVLQVLTFDAASELKSYKYGHLGQVVNTTLSDNLLFLLKVKISVLAEVRISNF